MFQIGSALLALAGLFLRRLFRFRLALGFFLRLLGLLRFSRRSPLGRSRRRRGFVLFLPVVFHDDLFHFFYDFRRLLLPFFFLFEAGQFVVLFFVTHFCV